MLNSGDLTKVDGYYTQDDEDEEDVLNLNTKVIKLTRVNFMSKRVGMNGLRARERPRKRCF